MYDALNKGIIHATGDIIGILNSDDYFCNNNIVNLIACSFNEKIELDAVIGDVAFINEKNKIFRHCSAKNWNISKFIVALIIINLLMLIPNLNKEEIKLLRIMENLEELFPKKIIGR